jgi:hypothetical protein
MLVSGWITNTLTIFGKVTLQYPCDEDDDDDDDDDDDVYYHYCYLRVAGWVGVKNKYLFNCF